MFDKITSLTNSKVKQIVRLRESKERAQEGRIIIDGLRESQRAWEAEVTFFEVFVCRDHLKDSGFVEKLESFKIPVYETTRNVFAKISYGEREEGILVLAKPPQVPLDDLPKKQNILLVVVEGVEKPGNLGAILRTSDGAGVDGVIVCDPKTDIYNPNVIRSSLGTVFSLKVVCSTNEAAYKFLKSQKVMICAATPQGDRLYTQANLKQSMAIVVGSEQSGLSSFWLEKSDLKVKIPMHGQVDSLNVSASSAVLLYEALRQRSV